MGSWSILPITLLLSLAGESNAAEFNPLNTGNQCYCGVPNAGEDRIIGGEDAGRGEFPWQDERTVEKQNCGQRSSFVMATWLKINFYSGMKEDLSWQRTKPTMVQLLLLDSLT